MSMIGRWKIRAVVLSIFVATNALTFWLHYAGHLTFPYDFLGGYNAHAFGWYADGNVLNPPRWFPWADLGFPAFIALQASSWYVPLVVLDILNISYSIHIATIVQCLHVLFGGLGMYALLRTLKFSWPIALLGGVCYHFSATFYSNQQHVDILRAAALLPWLLWSVHPANINRQIGTWIAAILIFQFLVGSYPGNIVSAAYGSAIFIALLVVRLDKEAAVKYVVALGVAGVAGILMSALKWWPLFEARDALSYSKKVPLPFSPEFLATFIFPYDVPFLPSDFTVRSLWIPSAMLCGLFFIKRACANVVLGLALAGSAIALASFVSVSDYSRFLPGLGISRIAVTDWRPSMHVGIIILGCCGWEALYKSKVGDESILKKALIVSIALMLCVSLALALGYKPIALLPGVIGIAGIVIISIASVLLAEKYQRQGAFVCAIMLVLVSVATGYLFHRSQGRAWMLPWDSKAEEAYLGVDFSTVQQDRGNTRVRRRPERLLIGSNQQEMLSLYVDTRYNACWYKATFCVFGYNNILLSKPHAIMHESFADPITGLDLLEFVRRPQQLILLPEDAAFEVSGIKNTSSKAEFISRIANAKAKIVRYDTNSIVYDIETPVAANVIENEIWWQGWMVQLCQGETCLPRSATSSTSEALRTWTVPPGQWRATLSFEVKGYNTARVAAVLALVLLAIYSTLKKRMGHSSSKGATKFQMSAKVPL
jgi:hypothetical protein